MKNFNKSYILTSMSGNMLEWYDFALYGYFSPIISKLFFSTAFQEKSLMVTFAIFAAGFLARPVGSIIFGHIGDVFGRKRALLISIATISISTFLIGLMPTYKNIGVYSPIFLTILRLIQGLSISGECTGAVTFLIEVSPKEKKYIFGSLVMAAVYSGLLLGSISGYVVSFLFTEKDLMEFGWRLPFFFSAIIGIGAFYLRLKCTESIEFEKVKIIHFPFLELLSKNLLKLIIAILLSSIVAVISYLLAVYFPTFITNTLHLSMKNSMSITMVTFTIMIIFIPGFGWIAEKYKEIPSIISMVLMTIFSIPIFLLISSHSYIRIMFSEIILSVILIPLAASIFTIINQLFPAEIRYSGAAFSYNISMTVFGGTAPLIAIFLLQVTGKMWSLAFYIMTCSILALISLIILSLTKIKHNNYVKI